MRKFYPGSLAVIAFAGAGAIMVAINIPSVSAALKNAAYLAVEPLQRSTWQAGAQLYAAVGPVFKSSEIGRENERLREQIAKLIGEKVAIEDLKKENELLRQSLHLELNAEFDLKLANIVGKDVLSDILLLDQGSRNMIEIGMPVITSQRGLVGKITKVYPNFSEVTLISEKDFSFDVKVGDDKVDGLVKGKGGFVSFVDLVPKDMQINQNDAVYTSGLGGIFPAGLVVGMIDRVNKNDVETFQSAAIIPAFNANTGRQVFIASGKYPLGVNTVAVPGKSNKNE